MTMGMDTRLAIALSAYDKAAQEARTLFIRKNAEYGNSIDQGGVIGAVVAFIGLPARLRTMVLHSNDHGRSNEEKVRDIALDIVNYGLILLLMITNDNWEGQD
jgi:hypothetical protein